MAPKVFDGLTLFNSIVSFTQEAASLFTKLLVLSAMVLWKRSMGES